MNMAMPRRERMCCKTCPHASPRPIPDMKERQHHSAKNGEGIDTDSHCQMSQLHPFDCAENERAQNLLQHRDATKTQSQPPDEKMTTREQALPAAQRERQARSSGLEGKSSGAVQPWGP
mmetsp:Transcript_23162/g.68376  ORF Transcript_23162/g.68376 Transcript_23162/m.68376 type:complete len:119 (-) Transcript_23162:357-713(-)